MALQNAINAAFHNKLACVRLSRLSSRLLLLASYAPIKKHAQASAPDPWGQRRRRQRPEAEATRARAAGESIAQRPCPPLHPPTRTTPQERPVACSHGAAASRDALPGSAVQRTRYALDPVDRFVRITDQGPRMNHKWGGKNQCHWGNFLVCN